MHVPAPGRHPRVELVVADRAALRALRLPHGIRTTTVVVRLDDADRVLGLSPRPEWAALVSLSARVEDGGCTCELVFAAPVPVHAVVAELGRQSVWPDRVGGRGIVLVGEELRKVPADLDPAAYPALPGPLDERVLNPTGFRADADGPVVDLPPGAPAAASFVDSLRGARGVRVDASSDPRTVAALAMAGVPLIGEPPASLGPAVADGIRAPVDLADPLAREEHSVVLRRAAHSTYSTHAWRGRLGELSGVRVHHQPAVSVVLATRRPEMLQHALAQVARQRGVDSLELVLAPHGFVPDLPPTPGVAVTVVPAAGDAVFGDVLNAAVAAAGGDVVLKMDDDDWYGPDFVLDLLLARAWSGAELVGTPDDWHYLEPRDTTIRLGTPVETPTGFVAGGSMLLDIGLLRELGGFASVPRAVDAHLIGAVRRAGGAIYRTHGLGYVLRKTGTGHTWAEDLDDLEARAATSYAGFRPSRLLGLAPPGLSRRSPRGAQPRRTT